MEVACTSEVTGGGCREQPRPLHTGSWIRDRVLRARHQHRTAVHRRSGPPDRRLPLVGRHLPGLRSWTSTEVLLGDVSRPYRDLDQCWRIVIWRHADRAYIAEGADESSFRSLHWVTAAEYASAWARPVRATTAATHRGPAPSGADSAIASTGGPLERHAWITDHHLGLAPSVTCAPASSRVRRRCSRTLSMRPASSSASPRPSTGVASSSTTGPHPPP